MDCYVTHITQEPLIKLPCGDPCAGTLPWTFRSRKGANRILKPVKSTHAYMHLLETIFRVTYFALLW